jgi:hypothetical protein
MTDREARKLIQKSIIKTSDKFTDELMHKVELQKNSEKKIKTHFLIACLICITLFLFISKLSLAINLLNLSPMIIRVLGSLFVFIMLNRLIILRNELLRAGENLTS